VINLLDAQKSVLLKQKILKEMLRRNHHQQKLIFSSSTTTRIFQSLRWNSSFTTLLHFTDSAKQFLEANNLDTIQKIKNVSEAEVNKTIVYSMTNHNEQEQQQQQVFDDFDKKIFDLFHSIVRLSPAEQKNVLFMAAERKQPMTIRAAIAAGVDVNSTEDTPSNRSALFIACLFGHLDCVKTLLELGADVDLASSRGGWNPLHISCEQGHVEIAELLLKVGADANKARSDGVKPIHILAQLRKSSKKSEKEVDDVTMGARPDQDLAKSLEQDENDAKNSAMTKIIRPLIEIGRADPNALIGNTTNSMNALYIAAKQGNAKFVRELIFVCLHRTDPIPLDLLATHSSSGATALFAAAESGNANVVAAFLEASPLSVLKSLLLQEDELYRTTPLGIAVIKRHAEVVRLLLGKNKKHIAVDVIDFMKNKPNGIHGATPLFAACEFDFPEIVEILLTEGKCDPNIPLKNENNKHLPFKPTPLVIAVSQGHHKVAHLLLKYAELTGLQNKNPVVSEDGATLIFLAAQNEDDVMVDLLCEFNEKKSEDSIHPAEIATESGLTPLSVAVHHGYRKVVRSLLRAGVSTTWELGQFKSLSQLALHKGHSEIFQLLAHHDKTPAEQAKQQREERKRREKKMCQVSEDDFKKHFKKE
jgi:ankyrin repeat protein